jgi:sodium-dependent phosphate transporter
MFVMCIQIWVMAVAGLCSSAGIIVLGHKVIATIGKNITDLDYHKSVSMHKQTCVLLVLPDMICEVNIANDAVRYAFLRGFCASFAAVVTVVLGTLLNLPLSTTHCTVSEEL